MHLALLFCPSRTARKRRSEGRVALFIAPQCLCEEEERMPAGLPVALAMLAQAASAAPADPAPAPAPPPRPSCGPAPPAPPKPAAVKAADDGCSAAQRSANTREIVICAQ